MFGGVLMEMVRVLSAHCPECGAAYVGLWNFQRQWGDGDWTAQRFPNAVVCADRVRNSPPCDMCKTGRVLYETGPVSVETK